MRVRRPDYLQGCPPEKMSLDPEEFGPRFRVLATECTETTYRGLKDDLVEHCRSRGERPLAIDFTNVHIVALRERDAAFRRKTDSMDLFIPDSMVLTWAVNWRGGRMPDRVYGPQFLSYMIEQSPRHVRHYFLGASQECLDQLLVRIGERNPHFQVVGSHHGYFGPGEEEAVLDDLNAAEPDLIWVGLGTPRQQEWIHRVQNRGRGGALLAVGVAFDVNAGTKRDAPPWMQNAGLTWLYRLSQEPRRLWKRYLFYNTVFLHGLLMQRLREARPGPGRNPGNRLEALLPGAMTPGPESGPRRCNVLGVGISVIDLKEGAEVVVSGADRPGRTGYVTVTGVHGVMESQRDPGLRRIHNRSFLTTPDGMPMVWVGKWNGCGEIDRVYGPDLMLQVMQATAGTGRRHFFFGGKEGVARELGERMQSWFPGTEVAGVFCPPFRPLSDEEEESLVAQLRQVRPHFFWVGLSTPKQERFMHDFLARHPDLCEDWDHGLIMLGVGAAFDFHTGRVSQAPRWMQRRGLEWFFRLCQEPRRLWRRYSINNTGFIFAILPQLMDLNTYPIEK